MNKLARVLNDILLKHNISYTSYTSHVKKTTLMAFKLFLASLSLLIHAFVPKFFRHVASDTVESMYITEITEKMKKDENPNEEYPKENSKDS